MISYNYTILVEEGFYPSEEWMSSTSHYSISLSLLSLPPLLSFWAVRVLSLRDTSVSVHGWRSWLGWGLQSLLIKKTSTATTVLEVEVGVGAIGAGEPLVMPLIRVCWAVWPYRPLGCQVTRGICLPVWLMQGKACGVPVSWEGWKDSLALFQIFGVPIGLQMWRLPVGRFLR